MVGVELDRFAYQYAWHARHVVFFALVMHRELQRYAASNGAEQRGSMSEAKRIHRQRISGRCSNRQILNTLALGTDQDVPVIAPGQPGIGLGTGHTIRTALLLNAIELAAQDVQDTCLVLGAARVAWAAECFVEYLLSLAHGQPQAACC